MYPRDVFFRLVIFTLVQYAVAYPSGAPSGVCITMAPNVLAHKAQPQTSQPPYRVHVDKGYYAANESVIVSVKSCGEAEIEGILIQAREMGSDKAVGSFTALPTDTKYLNCSSYGADSERSVVTHSKQLHDVHLLKFSWLPHGMNTSGSLYFLATIVQHKETYWVKIKSAELKQLAPGESKPAPVNLLCDSGVISTLNNFMFLIILSGALLMA